LVICQRFSVLKAVFYGWDSLDRQKADLSSAEALESDDSFSDGLANLANEIFDKICEDVANFLVQCVLAKLDGLAIDASARKEISAFLLVSASHCSTFY
jgi:hypothetical protein